MEMYTNTVELGLLLELGVAKDDIASGESSLAMWSAMDDGGAPEAFMSLAV